MDKLVRAWVYSCLLLAACGDDADDKGAFGWGGEGLHLTAQGKVNGETISLELDEDAVLAGDLHCELEYTAPALANGEADYANGKLTEIKIEGFVDVDGERRGLEIELKRHDFQSDEPGAVVDVIPRSDSEDPAAGEAWLEWEWHDAEDDAELYQAAASEGSITLHLFDGELNETGLVKDNVRVGVTFEGRWSETEEMKTSLTVDCPNVETVVEVEQ